MQRSFDRPRNNIGETPKKLSASELESTYGLDRKSMWIPEIAEEAAETFAKEEKGKSKEEVMGLLFDRCVDAFYPPNAKDSDAHIVTDMGIEAVCVDKLIDTVLSDEGAIGKIININNNGESYNQIPDQRDFNAKIYGTDIFAFVGQGAWAKVPKSEVRVLGSAKFSWCSAIVGKNKQGELCFAHVLGGNGVNNLKDYAKPIIEQKFGDGDYVLITPERKFHEGSDLQQVEIAERRNQEYAEYAEELGIPHHTYTEMVPIDGSLLADVNMSYTMIFDGDNISIKLVESVDIPSRGNYYDILNKEEHRVVEDWPSIDISL